MNFPSKPRSPANRQPRPRPYTPRLEVLEDRLQPGSVLLGQEWTFLASNLTEPGSAFAASLGAGARAIHFRPTAGDEQSRPSAAAAAVVLALGDRSIDHRLATETAVRSDFAQSSARPVPDDWLALSAAKQRLATPATAASRSTMNRLLSARQVAPVQPALPLLSHQTELSAVPTHNDGRQDPGLQATRNWATYVTGTPTVAMGRAVTLDGAGNAYVAGSTDEGTTKKAFVAKYDPSGVQLFLTKFQATDVVEQPNVNYNHSEAHGIALDGSGNIYVTGKATNPTTRHADAFVMRLDGNGNVDASYGVGFNSPLGDVSGNGIVVTPDGTATITGTARFAANDVFLAQIAADGSVSYGHAFDPRSFQQGDFSATFGNAIALAGDGQTGYISGTGMHTNGDKDILVILVDTTSGIPSGYSFASNPGDDSGNGIVVGGPSGTVYQTGTQTIKGNTYAVAINWSADLTTTAYGVYDADTTTGTAIDVDATGNIYLTGTAPDLFGNPRALVDKLDPAGAIADTLLIADTGSGQEAGFGIAFQDGTAYVAGNTTSSNLATDGSSLNGDQDVFLASVSGFMD